MQFYLKCNDFFKQPENRVKQPGGKSVICKNNIPNRFENVLSDIQSRPPNNFKLPVNPKNDIWHFY